jgi:hypothetical protein
MPRLRFRPGPPPIGGSICWWDGLGSALGSGGMGGGAGWGWREVEAAGWAGGSKLATFDATSLYSQL